MTDKRRRAAALQLRSLLNKDVHSKTYEAQRRSDVVHKIAEAYGFDEAHRDVEDTVIVHTHITQARCTDAQFIRRLAQLEGFEFYVDFDGLHFHRRRLSKKPLRVVQWFLPPDVGDIISFNVENDIFVKPGKVTVKGRDPLAKKDVIADGSDSDTKRDALAPIPDIAVDPSTIILTDVVNTDTRPTTDTSDAQAKRSADAAFRKTVQTAVLMDMELVGDPGVFAKSVLSVRGMGKRLSGLYYITQANHIIGENGYRLKCKLRTDGTNGKPLNIAAEQKSPSKKNTNTATGDVKDPGALDQIAVSDRDGTLVTQYGIPGSTK